jgi:ribosome-binding factor A
MHSGGKGRRTLRVANLIRQIVSEALIQEISDPRMAFVTVTGVDVSEDMRFADVRISVMGDKKQHEICLKAVQHAHGYVQERVAAVVKMRYCPVLRFHLDDSVKRSIEISQLIRQARAEDEAARAERIRRGIETPGDLPELEEAPPTEETPEEAGDEDDEDDEEA